MPLDKKYFSLEEVANKLGKPFTPNELIHIGAQGTLKMHVLAEGWLAYLWEEKATLDEDHHDEFALVPHSKRILTGPLPLPTEVLQKLEANPQTSINCLPANCLEEDSPDDIQIEYRFCIADDPTQLKSITLANCKIVMMNNQALKDFITANQEKSLQNTNPSLSLKTGKAPTKFVTILIKLLVEISARAAKKGLPFDVTEMPGQKKDLYTLACDFDESFKKFTLATFDTYIDGLCQFKQGAQETEFYKILFPAFYQK